ncbi:peptide-methionine (S)-S-oxide reductase MsrA [Pollutimonas bauzanensis]|uniref:Peptide methionine sulfoxide reductase MsrA n=1 Tax=Pollutimonas bauzanensis TaxID=658167 RepID=A0A1M5SKR5_9BURK|nr:peptide-methionine (S)-S-oxide reductase MsrA [Pollutimonas bauzanensis]SHH39099.1 peptide-methionine (S)-S-oxide reductase [Pollutimonas bauzanensis]
MTRHTCTNPSRAAATRLGAAALLAIAALACGIGRTHAAERAFVIAPPAMDEPASPSHKEKTAVFAGGCFWGVQAVFQHVKGVNQALSGYAGGKADSAHYDDVSTGRSGHAESVQVTYDPAQISYGQLLQIFFSVAHDPTQLNRQGPDTGTQYRSTIFAANSQQHEIAQAYIQQLDKSGVYPRPLATTIEDHKDFYPAETYHQDYLAHNKHSMYIIINDLPKVANLAKVFSDRYRDAPVLVNR